MSAASSNRIPVLQMIIAKVRRLTGSADAFQLPDVPDPLNPYTMGITDYINSFYLYDLPSQFRSLKLKDIYTFNTIQGQDTYAFDSENYTTVEQPAYVAGRETLLVYDPWTFYGLNYNWQYQVNFATSDGTDGPFAGFTNNSPIVASVNNDPTSLTFPASRVQNILITANTATGTLNVTDVNQGNGTGNLIGDAVSGTINYQTGQITNLVFTQAIPAGNPIQIQFNPALEAMPLSILFFQNQFTLKPTPNQGYTVKLVAYRQPVRALADTPAFQGNPELSEWWELLAVGASKKVYEDRLDFDGVAMMDKMLAERYQQAYTRTYAELGKQRINTIFADQLSYNYGAGPGPGGFGTG